MPEIQGGESAMDALRDHLAVVLRQPFDVGLRHGDVDHRSAAAEAQPVSLRVPLQSQIAILGQFSVIHLNPCNSQAPSPKRIALEISPHSILFANVGMPVWAGVGIEESIMDLRKILWHETCPSAPLRVTGSLSSIEFRCRSARN